VTAPGFVPRPDSSVIDRLVKIEARLRVMQQSTAGATTAVGGSIPMVATPSTITAPAAGSFAYCSTDHLLYQYLGGAWTAVAALGPLNQVTPDPGQVHEARYRATTNATAQTLSAANTAVQFGTADYTTNDVVASGTGTTTFTLQRAGLWTIDIGARVADTTAAITRQLQLTDSTFATVYKAFALPVATAATVDLSLSCTMRFPALAVLSVNAISSATGTIDRATATNAGRTSISLAWQRP
jgi:hypothetical protein